MASATAVTPRKRSLELALEKYYVRILKEDPFRSSCKKELGPCYRVAPFVRKCLMEMFVLQAPLDIHSSVVADDPKCNLFSKFLYVFLCLVLFQLLWSFVCFDSGS